MDYLTSEHLVSVYEGMRGCFAAPEAPDGADAVFELLRDSANLPALEFCLRSLVTAELDTKTAGERGIGRVSLSPPRLGGHFRPQLASLTSTQLWDLYYRLQDLVLGGYVGFAVLTERPLKPAAVRSADEMYRRWIPRIYSSSGRPGDSILESMTALVDATYGALAEELAEHGIDTTTQPGSKMLYHYAIAGINLRAVESGHVS